MGNLLASPQPPNRSTPITRTRPTVSPYSP